MSGSRLVYSTDSGRICPDCGRPVADCTCLAAARAVPPGSGTVRVSRAKRNGKTVTVVNGLPLDAAALAVLGKQLRAALAAGGTARDGVLEVQGDHVERVLAWLAQQGWPGKRSGG